MADAVAVIGAGSMGIGWSIVFARAGHAVRLYEPDAERRAKAPAEIAARLADLSVHGLLGGGPGRVAARIVMPETMASAIAGAAHVQECAPEDRALKAALFAEIDPLAPVGAVLASSSSAIVASAFATEVAGRARCLVAHPVNPPTLLPVVEIVPAPFTDASAVAATEALMHAAGMRPVVLGREIEGFVLNRLQGAILREAWCLVRDGVASVEDIDAIMTEGLGPRWAVIGPFETSDLNTRGGIEGHAARMGPAYARMGAERGQHDPWTAELVARVAASRRARLPLADWDERVAWRDRMLMRLVAAKREAEREEEDHGA